MVSLWIFPVAAPGRVVTLPAQFSKMRFTVQRCPATPTPDDVITAIGNTCARSPHKLAPDATCRGSPHSPASRAPVSPALSVGSRHHPYHIVSDPLMEDEGVGISPTPTSSQNTSPCDDQDDNDDELDEEELAKELIDASGRGEAVDVSEDGEEQFPSTISCTESVASIQGVARRGRIFAKRQRQRLVFKDGLCNISTTRVRSLRRRYIIDTFTTMMEIRWRYVILMFGITFVGSWLTFALMWWAICVMRGDHLHKGDGAHQPCMTEVHDFPSALLFSIETQHTIGYGTRAMEPKCPEAVFLLMFQSCCGVFIQSLMTGMIFAKLSRPKKRAHTIVFSKNAVICRRDGELCLQLRVGDVRKSHIVGTIIRAMLVKNRITKEGEMIPLWQFPLAVETETCTDPSDPWLFLIWPLTVAHRINDTSPLWNISAEQLLTERFEIIVIIEGTIESTGMTTQFRTSYLPAEILWGHRLAPLLTYQKENGQYKVDYTQFHSTIPTPTPEASAKDQAHSGVGTRSSRPSGDLLHYPINFTAPPAFLDLPTKTQSGTPRSVFRRMMRASLKGKRSLRSMQKSKSSEPSVAASKDQIEADSSCNGSIVNFVVPGCSLDRAKCPRRSIPANIMM